MAALTTWAGPALGAEPQLELGDVQRVIAQAASHASRISPRSVIAVVDREGFVLGVWATNGRGAPAAVASAISKAGTAAFLSSNQNAFSSRTAGFIVQDNFPPGVDNRPPGPLVGVGFSNLPFSDVNRFKGPGSLPGTLGTPVLGTSLSGSPGGMPLYKSGVALGGVGVAGDGSEGFIHGMDRDEEVALAGQSGFTPRPLIQANNVFIDGIALVYQVNQNRLKDVKSLGSVGAVVPPYTLRASPPPPRVPRRKIGGADVEVRVPIRGDPLSTRIDGQKRLTSSEVNSILTKAAARSRITRAGIRLPRGQLAQVWVSVVNNPNRDGVAPQVLGVIRIGDAPFFSYDVAVQKARTALFFSSDRLAQSTRTIGFLAQRRFPPGISNTKPGAYFGLQERFSTQPNPNLPNGITIFPGGFPLYRNDVLIGAIGVSGDGVDQDDIIAAAGTVDFLAPDRTRADRYRVDGARLPYAKFPRNPVQ